MRNIIIEVKVIVINQVVKKTTLLEKIQRN